MMAAGETWRRWLPLTALAAGLAAFFALGLHQSISVAALARHRGMLLAFVADNGALSPILYCAAYALVVAFSVPGGAVLTITGGFLFGTLAGTVYAVIGATLGAVAVFLAARSALTEPWQRRAGPWLQRFEAGFRRDAFNYMLVLRLVPLFPFWLVNLVPALLDVPLRTYTLATLIGIIPGALVYASVGNGLGAVLEAGRTPDLGVITRPEVLLPLLSLAALALVPVAWRRWRKE